MLTPAQIKIKAERKYPEFLRSLVLEEPFFPLEINFGRPSPTADYLLLRDAVQPLLAGSKAQKGFGYTVELEPRQTRKHGLQTLPSRVFFENASDYLRLLGKQKEVGLFETAVGQTLAQWPQLRPWLAKNPLRVVENLAVWDGVLVVCAYFVAHPRPNCYPRELPIPVHTKFVEQNEKILRPLLDELLPETALDSTSTTFATRFGLCQPEPLFRLRLLDGALRGRLGWPSDDLAMPLSALAGLDLSAHPLFIVENQLTFLTFPAVPNGLALWGQGDMAARLAAVAWLGRGQIWYWGDLDTQGFEILAGLRAHFPHIQSLMMDEATLTQFTHLVRGGMPNKKAQLTRLNETESAAYEHLHRHHQRLEQEHLPHLFVIHKVNNRLR
jgi:hypothetical protein